jgi:hypothetical protein
VDLVTCERLTSSGSAACTQRQNEEIDTFSLCSSGSRWWIVATAAVPSSP